MRHNNLHDLSAFDFKVSLLDIYDSHGNKIPGYCRVVRADDGIVLNSDGTTLAVHGSGYKLTPHVDVFKSTIEVLEDVLRNTGSWPDGSVCIDEREPYDIRDHVFNEGRQVLREIICRSISVDGPDNQRIQFRIRQINSYDASSRYQMMCGIYREWCSNGAATIIGALSSTSQKHTSKINIAAEKGKLRAAIESFIAQPDTWRGWYKSEVKTDDVIRLFANTLVAEKGIDPATGFTRYNKKQLGILTDSWERNSLQLGRNKWAVYQAATWWASHGESDKRTPEQISLERDPLVRDMVNSEMWRNL